MSLGIHTSIMYANKYSEKKKNNTLFVQFVQIIK